MFTANEGEFLFQSGGLDRQIEWNHWAKEKAKMGKIVRNFHVLLTTLFLSRLCHNCFSQVNSTEGVLSNDDF